MDGTRILDPALPRQVATLLGLRLTSIRLAPIATSGSYTLWPDRVREKCKTDRSLAIAHGLKELCEIKAPEPKRKRAAKQAAKKKGKVSEHPEML